MDIRIVMVTIIYVVDILGLCLVGLSIGLDNRRICYEVFFGILHSFDNSNSNSLKDNWDWQLEFYNVLVKILESIGNDILFW